MKRYRLLPLAFWVAVAALATTSCKSIRAKGTVRETVPLEQPMTMSGVAEQVIWHKGFIVSYNESTRLPNWVAYELTADEVAGSVPRARHFDVDPMVNGAQATNEDYRNSGWDKGHIVPAGDMKWDSVAMRESFYFSNVCPQNHRLNGGDWRSLEEQCRVYARQYGRVWIVAGPVVGGNRFGTIGYNRVVVPDAFFKVIMVKNGDDYVGIGFCFDNEAAGNARKLSHHAMSIDEVEQLTGLDFFYTLPDSIEDAMEGRMRLDFWFP